jgi:predicted dinucleotide-binding enzyme
MQIGIIGSGNVGKTLGEAWLKRGHRVLFGYSRGLEKLRGCAAPSCHFFPTAPR